MSAQVMRVPAQANMSAPDAASNDGRPIDLVHLSRQTLGDRDLEMELLGLFERQAGQIMDQISLGSGDGGRSLRRDLAHTLKGSARAVGAGAVAQAAHDYENCLESAAGTAALAEAQARLGGAVDAARAAVLALLADR